MVLSARTEQRASDARIEALRPAGSARLWTALALPPVAWFAALNAAYFFVSWTCGRDGGSLLLHAITLAALGLAIGAGALGWGLLRDVGRDGDDGIDDQPSRTRFLAWLAVAGAATFALVLIAQWLAILILDPCATRPRLRHSPDALRSTDAAAAVAYLSVDAVRYDGVRLVVAAATTSTSPSTTCGTHT